MEEFAFSEVIDLFRFKEKDISEGKLLQTIVEEQGCIEGALDQELLSLRERYEKIYESGKRFIRDTKYLLLKGLKLTETRTRKIRRKDIVLVMAECGGGEKIKLGVDRDQLEVLKEQGIAAHYMLLYGNIDTEFIRRHNGAWKVQCKDGSLPNIMEYGESMLIAEGDPKPRYSRTVDSLCDEVKKQLRNTRFSKGDIRSILYNATRNFGFQKLLHESEDQTIYTAIAHVINSETAVGKFLTQDATKFRKGEYSTFVSALEKAIVGVTDKWSDGFLRPYRFDSRIKFRQSLATKYILYKYCKTDEKEEDISDNWGLRFIVPQGGEEGVDKVYGIAKAIIAEYNSRFAAPNSDRTEQFHGQSYNSDDITIEDWYDKPKQRKNVHLRQVKLVLRVKDRLQQGIDLVEIQIRRTEDENLQELNPVLKHSIYKQNERARVRMAVEKGKLSLQRVYFIHKFFDPEATVESVRELYKI